jgi:TRAP-type uncharacterized transport system fused permease subunit
LTKSFKAKGFFIFYFLFIVDLCPPVRYGGLIYAGVAIATPASWSGITCGFRFARRLRFLPASCCFKLF